MMEMELSTLLSHWDSVSKIKNNKCKDANCLKIATWPDLENECLVLNLEYELLWIFITILLEYIRIKYHLMEPNQIIQTQMIPTSTVWQPQVYTCRRWPKNTKQEYLRDHYSDLIKFPNLNKQNKNQIIQNHTKKITSTRTWPHNAEYPSSKQLNHIR